MVVIAKDSNCIARYLLTDAAGNLNILLTDGTTIAGVNPASSGIYVFNGNYSLISSSNMWIASYKWAAVGAGASVFFHIKVGAGKNAHGVIRITTETLSTYYVYENPTLTNDGTALSNVCENRENPVASTTLCYRDPVITANGTQLEIGTSGSDNRFHACGSTISDGGYFLLKKSEDYLVRVDNDDGVARDISVAYMWFED